MEQQRGGGEDFPPAVRSDIMYVQSMRQRERERERTANSSLSGQEKMTEELTSQNADLSNT